MVAVSRIAACRGPHVTTTDADFGVARLRKSDEASVFDARSKELKSLEYRGRQTLE